MTKISTKTLLHLTHCKRCYEINHGPAWSNICKECLVHHPEVAEAAAREFGE